MQRKENIDQLKLQLHRLVPEHLHPEDCSERPEEREKQKFLFRRSPFTFRGLPLVEGECREGDYIEEDVDCEKDEDVLHLDIFRFGEGYGFWIFFVANLSEKYDWLEKLIEKFAKKRIKIFFVILTIESQNIYR